MELFSRPKWAFRPHEANCVHITITGVLLLGQARPPHPGTMQKHSKIIYHYFMLLIPLWEKSICLKWFSFDRPRLKSFVATCVTLYRGRSKTKWRCPSQIWSNIRLFYSIFSLIDARNEWGRNRSGALFIAWRFRGRQCHWFISWWTEQPERIERIVCVCIPQHDSRIEMTDGCSQSPYTNVYIYSLYLIKLIVLKQKFDIRNGMVCEEKEAFFCGSSPTHTPFGACVRAYFIF